MIRGITVLLIHEVETGRDDFNAPIYEEIEEEISDVLVGQPTADDIVASTELYGRKAVYTLAIPKGDTHKWENQKVRFFGEDWRVFGIPTEGIEENIPLRWNKKVMVERYE